MIPNAPARRGDTTGMVRATVGVTLLAVALLLPATASAVDWNFRGYIQSDARFSLPGPFEKPDTGEHPRFIRNETELQLRMDVRANRHVQGTADVKLVFTGKRDAVFLEDTTLREKSDPYRLESDALFVTFRDIGDAGVDLSIGRMILPWGTGDMFNPTRKLNPLDLEDPLEFGDSLANQMVLLEWFPDWYVETDDGDEVFGEVKFQLAAVPVFRGALLPSSSLIAFDNPTYSRDRFHSQIMSDLFDLQEAFSARGGQLSYDVRGTPPEVALRNVQLGAKFAFSVLGSDISLSYYRGFDDMPRPESVYAEDVALPAVPAASATQLLDIVEGMCPPGEDCLSQSLVHNRIRLTYPRIHMVGADVSTTVPFLADLGLWGEVAVVFHDDLHLQVRTSDALVPLAGELQPFGVAQTLHELEYDQGVFVKAVVGIDHTPLPWLYLNIQYLHGFVDEFGSIDLNDYIVAGTDFKFWGDRILLRLFGIFCIQDQSAVIYPQLSFTPWDAGQITVGALFYVGDNDSKFGSPLTGPSTVFVRGRFSF